MQTSIKAEKEGLAMKCRMIPNNLKPGARSCIVTVSSDVPLLSVRWRPKDTGLDEIREADKANRVRIERNGTYVIELVSEEGRLETEFSICHLRPQSGFAGGDGSRESPYLVSNCAQFNAIRDDMSAHYRLISDLNFQKEMNNPSWIPMGTFKMD